MSIQRAALLSRHSYSGMSDGERYKIVLMKQGQSEDFDPGAASRTWLWPHLGDTHHLIDFIDVEIQQ